MFEPGVESSNQGASLAAWSLDSGADFIGEPGEPTHRAGHTIDLTFSNIPFAETTVRHDLDCGSDHFTLITIVPEKSQGADSNTGFRVTEANLPSYAKARQRSEPDQERKRRTMLSTIRNAKRDYWRRDHRYAADADLPQHGGALPKRSAVDLVASFVYDVESAFAQGKEVTLVTLDVQGARSMRCYYPKGFGTDAKAGLAYGAAPANQLVPSGSQGQGPAGGHVHRRIEDAMRNPTRFAAIPRFYTFCIWRNFLNQDRALRFGYADDIAIYRASKSVGKQRSHARARYTHTPDYEMGRYEQSGLCAGETGNDTPLAETKRKLT
ncbi:hypothetical protein DID88_002614 [Monilinia fructigena]|uniref:Endonuclease/exonuclease/phosphatase domain-containing protein n=1 Tax=Monilinia fructigena TaxID=38457 RepID=A0A395IRA2_9HELO|nr:hypothetical protein DID88_002614 [Monilinia fructigena]